MTPKETTFTSEVNPDVKVIPYDAREVANLKEQCPDSVRGIMAVSDAVEIWMDGECDDTKNISVQVSMDDEEDQDSQLVVIRFKEGKVQVLDKSQCRLTKDRNSFLVEKRVSGG